MVVRATVEASLYYASETRAFTSREISVYQLFLNRCLRCNWLSVDFKLRDMKGVVTMQDVRVRVGQDTVATSLGQRKIGYIGHIARYPEDRLERQLVFGQIEVEGTLPRSSKMGTTWRSQTRALLQQFMAFAPALWKDKPWQVFAQQKVQWARTTKEWLKARRAVDALHTHMLYDMPMPKGAQGYERQLWSHCGAKPTCTHNAAGHGRRGGE